jgi:site-specific recombinase XerD
MDLPIVEYSEQKRPSLKANAVSGLISVSAGQEQALYVLLAATGMRISEALGLEVRHIINDGRTVKIEQQVEKDRPQIVKGARCLEDINNFWMAQKPKTMSEIYSHLHEELQLRLDEAERVGYGFTIPRSVDVVPSVPGFSERESIEIAA